LAFAFSEDLVACGVKQAVRRLQESKILRRDGGANREVERAYE